MKINTAYIFLISLLALSACQDKNLTKDKAEVIVRECQLKTDKKVIKARTIDYGLIEINKAIKAKFPEKMNQYIALSEKGLVTIDTLPSKKENFGGLIEVYQIFPTPLASESLISSDTLHGKVTGKFRICEYNFDSVTEVHEIPEKNIASVKVKFIRTNETPFFRDTDEKKQKAEKMKTIPFRKTTDGWKLCD
ncbi:hypothetical protein [Mesonia sp.]|uniref:hypothetical protein n=1 Tax=Mesonia sp. TaxID=1960830 RepID=UPI003F9CC06A